MRHSTLVTEESWRAPSFDPLPTNNEGHPTPGTWYAECPTLRVKSASEIRPKSMRHCDRSATEVDGRLSRTTRSPQEMCGWIQSGGCNRSDLTRQFPLEGNIFRIAPGGNLFGGITYHCGRTDSPSPSWSRACALIRDT